MAKQYHQFNTVLVDKDTGITFYSNELEREGQSSLFEMYNPSKNSYEFKEIDTERFHVIDFLKPLEGKGDVNISYYMENGQSFEAIKEIYKQVSGLESFEKIYENNPSKLNAIKEACKVEYDQKVEKEKSNNKNGNPTIRFEYEKNLLAKLDKLGIERDIHVYLNADNPDAGNEYDEDMANALSESPYLNLQNNLEKLTLANGEYEYYLNAAAKESADSFKGRNALGTFNNFMSGAADMFSSTIPAILCRLAGIVNMAIHAGPGATEYYKTAAKLHPFFCTYATLERLKDLKPGLIAARNEKIELLKELKENEISLKEYKAEMQEKILEMTKDLKNFEKNQVNPIEKKIENQKEKIKNLETKLEKATEKGKTNEVEKIKQNLETEKNVLAKQTEKAEKIKTEWNTKKENIEKFLKTGIANKEIEKDVDSKDKKEKDSKENENKTENPKENNEKTENNENKKEKKVEKNSDNKEKNLEDKIKEFEEKYNEISKNEKLSDSAKEKALDSLFDEINALENEIDNSNLENKEELLDRLNDIGEEKVDLNETLEGAKKDLSELNSKDLSDENVEDVSKKVDQVIDKIDKAIDDDKKDKTEKNKNDVKNVENNEKRISVIDRINNYVENRKNDLDPQTISLFDEIKNLITEIDGKINTMLESNLEKQIEVSNEPVVEEPVADEQQAEEIVIEPVVEQPVEEFTAEPVIEENSTEEVTPEPVEEVIEELAVENTNQNTTEVLNETTNENSNENIDKKIEKTPLMEKGDQIMTSYENNKVQLTENLNKLYDLREQLAETKEEKHNTENRLAEVNGKIVQYESNIESLSQEKDKAQNDLVELKNQLAIAKNEVQVEVSRRALDKTQNKIESKEKSIENLNSKLNELNVEKNTLENKLEQLNARLEYLNNEYRDVLVETNNGSTGESPTMLAAVERDLKNAEKEKEQLKRDLGKIENKIENTKENKQELENKISELEKNYENLKNDYDQKVESLKEQNDNVKEILDAITSKEQVLELTEAYISDYKTEIAEYEGTIKELEQKMDNINNDINSIEKEIIPLLETAYNDVEKVSENTSETKNAVDAYIKEIEGRINDIDKERNELIEKLGTLDSPQEIKETQAKIDNLKAEKEVLSEKLSEAEKVSSDLDNSLNAIEKIAVPENDSEKETSLEKELSGKEKDEKIEIINNLLTETAKEIDSKSAFSNVEVDKDNKEVKVDEFNPVSEKTFEYSLGCTDKTMINTLRIEQVDGENTSKLEIVLDKNLSERIYHTRALAAEHDQKIPETKFEEYMKSIDKDDINYLTINGGDKITLKEALKDENILPTLEILAEYCSDDLKDEIMNALEPNLETNDVIENSEHESNVEQQEDFNDDYDYNPYDLNSLSTEEY